MKEMVYASGGRVDHDDGGKTMDTSETREGAGAGVIEARCPAGGGV